MTLATIPPKLSLLVALCASLAACAAPGADDEQAASAQEQTDITCDDDAKPPPKACGGPDALTCAQGQFCNTERIAGGQGCEVPEARGVCEPVAEVCTLEYRPVCGCDHRTYPTACRAHFYGVSVLHDGACTPDDCAAAGGEVVEGARVDAEVECPADQEDRGIVQTASRDASGADAVCCVPRATQACREVKRISLTNEAIAEVVQAAPTRGADVGLAYRTGDSISILPRSPAPGSFLEVRDGAKLGGFSLVHLGASAFMVAGETAAQQIIGLHLGGPGASASVLDPATRQWGERRAFSQDLRFHGQTRQVAASPALDGLRSVFAMGNRVVGPVDVGVMGPGGVPVGAVTRACTNGQDCVCLTVLPGPTAGTVSMLQFPKTEQEGGPRWRTIALDASGKVLRDASIPVEPPGFGCPLVAQSGDGPVGIFGPAAAPNLTHFDHPERAVRLSDGRSALGMVVSGDDALLLQYGEPTSVVRATRGVVDERSRLRLPGVGFDVQVIAGEGDELTLYYATDASREIVTVSCHR